MNPTAQASTDAASSVPSTPSAEIATDAPQAPAERFAEVPASLRPSLEARGFEDLTEVQRAVLANSVEGRDFKISSETGSGKTVALGFVLAASLEGPAAERGPDALIIVPTRELATQVCAELRWLFANLPEVAVASVTGGTPVFRERRVLARHPRVLVGTPGRLLDHIKNGALDLSGVRELVLDEADQMLDMGFREELEGILDKTPATRRTHLVSATFPQSIQRLAERYQREPVAIEGTRLGEANKDIRHEGFLVKSAERYSTLVDLLLKSEGERTIVFVERRAEAVEVAERLARDGFAALPLSGELMQSQRERTLDAFRQGRANVLVATDVAARGLDVPDVAVVVQTTLPIDAQVYTHRSGRTGRAGKTGRSVLFAPPNRRRRLKALLAGAGVDVDWLPVPHPNEVRAQLALRARREVDAKIDETLASKLSKERLAHAAELLEGREAIPLIAALLTRLDPRPASEHRQDDGPQRANGRDSGRREGRSDDRYNKHDDRRGGRRDDTFKHRSRREFNDHQSDRPGRDTRFGKGRDDRGDRGYKSDRAGRKDYAGDRGGWNDRRNGGRQERPWHKDRSSFGDRSDQPSQDRMIQAGTVRFFMNFGKNQGASPGRLLAAVCRRGKVSGSEIGSIAIHPNASTFDVSAAVAENFERLASRRDARDPKTHIRRDRGPR